MISLVRSIGTAPTMRPRMIPREHGAYVVLTTAYISGLLVAPDVPFTTGLLELVSIAAAFVLQEPLRHLGRQLKKASSFHSTDIQWAAALWSAAALSFALLAAERPLVLWLLIPIVILSMVMAILQQRNASMFTQSLIGFPALTLAAPFVLIASGGTSLMEALILWAVLQFFYIASAMTVNLRIDPSSLKRVIRFYVIYAAHGIFIPALPMAPWIFWAGFGISFVRFLWVATNLGSFRALPLKVIGWQETALSLGLLVALQILQR